MTNYERLMKNMTVEQLASYMVNVEMVDDGYYSYDDEWESWYREHYTSCANEYSYDSFEECKEDLIKWLNKESEV